MILIGLINVALGYLSWPDTPFDRTPERIIPVLPVSQYARHRDAGPVDATTDAKVDAATDAKVDTATDAGVDAGSGSAAPR